MAAIINTGPLPSERAGIVENLLQSIIADHPGIDGFILTGSIWNPDTQLPYSDIDINWHGFKNDAIDDPRVTEQSIFQVAGVTIELARYFWGELSQLESLRLSVVVTLSRAHILWEKDGVFSVPQQRAQKLLQDSQWVKEAIGRYIADLKQRADNWLDPVYCRENKDNHDGFDFVRTVIGPTTALLDPIDLRPPSAARKALMDITQTSALYGLPDLSESILRCLGADQITTAEIEQWNGRLDALYSDITRLRPEVQLVKWKYHVLGIQAMIAKGYPRECVWPLWRGFLECKKLLDGISPKGEEAFVQFGERLQVRTVEDISRKAVQYAAIIDRLHSQQKRLADHLLSVAKGKFV